MRATTADCRARPVLLIPSATRAAMIGAGLPRERYLDHAAV